MGKNMKGQMFIIAAIIIIISMVSLKGIFDSTIGDERSLLQTESVERRLDNIKNEYSYIVNTPQPGQAIAQYIYDFSVLLKNDERSDISIIYVYVNYNKTNNNYSVTLANFLGERKNFTIEASRSYPSTKYYGFLDDMQQNTEFFIVNPGSENVSIVLKYDFSGFTVTETFSFEPKIDMQLLFSDITLKGNTVKRSKDVFINSLNQTIDTPVTSGSIPITCGNGVCDSGESCNNCQTDCGPCDPGPTGCPLGGGQYVPCGTCYDQPYLNYCNTDCQWVFDCTLCGGCSCPSPGACDGSCFLCNPNTKGCYRYYPPSCGGEQSEI